jgi:hypothetical protein
MIEQEKAILEDEYGNALNLNEELQVQYEQIQRVKCDECHQREERSSANLINMSSQLHQHLQFL